MSRKQNDRWSDRSPRDPRESRKEYPHPHRSDIRSAERPTPVPACEPDTTPIERHIENLVLIGVAILAIVVSVTFMAIFAAIASYLDRQHLFALVFAIEGILAAAMIYPLYRSMREAALNRRALRRKPR